VRQKIAPVYFCNIALSKLHLLRQFRHTLYFSKLSITHVFDILYITRDGEPPKVLKVQQSSTLCTHNHRAALLRDAGLKLLQRPTCDSRL